MNADHKSLETVFSIAIRLLKNNFVSHRIGGNRKQTLLTIDERGSKIARNRVIQISLVANLDMSRGVPTCMQIRMCV